MDTSTLFVVLLALLAPAGIHCQSTPFHHLKLNVSPMQPDVLVGQPIAVSVTGTDMSGEPSPSMQATAIQIEGRRKTGGGDVFVEEFGGSLIEWEHEEGSLGSIDTTIGAFGTPALRVNGPSLSSSFKSGLCKGFGNGNKAAHSISFYLRSSDSTTEGPYVSLLDRFDNPAIVIAMTQSGLLHIMHSTGVSEGIEYTANTWYNVKITLDWQSKSLDFFVNGELIEQNVSMYSSSPKSTNKLCIFNRDDTSSWVDQMELIFQAPSYEPVSVSVDSIQFGSGTWGATVTLHEETANVQLLATYGDISGRSNEFDVVAISTSQVGSKSGGEQGGDYVVIASLLGATLFFLALVTAGLLVVLYFYRKNHKKGNTIVMNVELGHTSVSHSFSNGSINSCNSQYRSDQVTIVVSQDMAKTFIDKEALKMSTDAEMIGKGAFGIVFKAEYHGKEVAVKELFSEHIGPEDVESFVAEAEMMRSIPPHENVVNFLGVCIHPFCLVTEFLPRGNLHNYIKEFNGQIDERLKKKWISDIARGMQHLTDNGVIHRDLACRNVLLSEDLSGVVSDFGMARFSSDSNAVYSKGDIGPLKWMSIEALSKRKFSEKSDVWSFGITCVEIFGEGDPYPEVDAVQAATMVIANGARPKVPDTVPHQLEGLIPSCWAEDPEDRPSFQTICSFLDKAF